MLGSPLRYPGGKSRAIKQILPRFPKEFKVYREPFVGGGSVLLALLQERPDIVAVASDMDTELIWFWQTIQNNACSFDLIREIETVHHRLSEMNQSHGWDACKYFLERRRDSELLQPFEYYVINRVSWCGLGRMGGFTDMSRFNFDAIRRLRDYAGILRNCSFVIDDYRNQLAGTDPDDFVFLDPTYLEHRRLYRHDSVDHAEMSEILNAAKFKWLMTIDDVPRARELFKGQNFEPLKFTYSMNNSGRDKKQKRVAELMISNY